MASKVLGVEMVTRGAASSTSAERAIQVYLADRSTTKPGWAYPSFLRDRGPVDGTEMQLDIDESLWQSLAGEAVSQGVPTARLLEHAVLYLAAEESAGRLTQRILEDLDPNE